MAKKILIVGYSKISYIQKIRSYFPGEDVVLMCAYSRPASTEAKQKFLNAFDELYDLNKEADMARLKDQADTIDCITCTQERDMIIYIETLQLCGKITEVQAENYRTLIDKDALKTSLRETNPELVPEHNVITEELLTQLDTLSYPQIIKPSGLAGSIMIRVVHSPEEFKEHYEKFSHRMHEIAGENYNKEIKILAESYIDGPQYSVNVYIDATGTVTFCPIARVVTPQELGINDTYSVFQYTTDEVSETDYNALKSAVQTIVDRFQIKDTSAHFDSVLQNGQWKFFEVGLRIGGNRQELFERSHGMDHFKNDIYNHLGEKIVIPPSKAFSCIVQKAAVEHGVLKSISYTRKVTEDKQPLVTESKLAKLGVDVMPLSLGGATLARFFVTGANRDEVYETSKELFDSVHFEIT